MKHKNLIDYQLLIIYFQVPLAMESRSDLLCLANILFLSYDTDFNHIKHQVCPTFVAEEFYHLYKSKDPFLGFHLQITTLTLPLIREPLK